MLLGSLEFSTEREEKEKILFKAVKSLMSDLPATDSWEIFKLSTIYTDLHLYPGDHLTYLQRQLKRKAMTTYFDNRGVRRLSLLCDFIAKVTS